MSTSTQPQTAPAPAEVWATGDYAEVCDRMIPDLGARLVRSAAVGAGHDVLDVATGSGNAAVPAALAGATVTGLDITPALLAVAAQRSTAVDVDVDWVHGDAEALPFGDASFDRVLSCVGVQFCARPDAAAAELVRVCRPGGRIALVAWTPEGFLGQVLAAVSQATGKGPRPASLNWGREPGVTDLFAPHATDVEFHRDHVVMESASAEAWVDYMATAYGPLVRACVALEQRGAWQPLRAQLIEIADEHDGGDGSAFAGRAEYLTTVLRRDAVDQASDATRREAR